MVSFHGFKNNLNNVFSKSKILFKLILCFAIFLFLFDDSLTSAQFGEMVPLQITSDMWVPGLGAGVGKDFTGTGGAGGMMTEEQ